MWSLVTTPPVFCLHLLFPPYRIVVIELFLSDGRLWKATFVRSVRQELSCALWRNVLLVYILVQAVGRQLMPGCECPINESDEVLALSTNLGVLDLLFGSTLPFNAIAQMDCN